AYTFSNNDPYDMLYVSFGFVGGNLMIMSDDFNYTTGTAVKQTSSGGETEGNTVVEKDTQYSITANADGYIIVDFKTPGTYKLTYDTSSVFSATVGDTTVANGGTFTVADDETVTISIKSMSGISVTFKIVSDAPTGGEEEGTEGFTEAQQGIYSYTYSMYGGTFTEHLNYVVGQDYVIINSSNGNNVLTAVSKENGVYTFNYDYYGTTFAVTFSFDNDGNLAVVSDELNDLSDIVAEKQTPTALSVSNNTIPNPDPEAIFTGTAAFTATEAGSYTFTFANLYKYGSTTIVNGESVEIDDTDGSATITIELTAGQTISILVDQPSEGTVSLTITKA
ncbi:MAG: hypothetical protein ACI4MC_02685, partial [Candidatus Coproplasma sp.]